MRTAELADKILSELETGRSLRDVCRDEGMPSEAMVRRWAREDAEFGAQYARAREIGYHAMADELLEISDDGQNDWMERNGEDSDGWQVNGEHLQRSRLRVDTRKWLLSKALPKIYGDKIDHTSSDGTMTPKCLDVSGLPTEVLQALMDAKDASES